ncbi:hypothetical protein [Streptomyces noursei]|uniref:hypothetical protein n=1 Tax=Streptomyces noursei TaxID=1971 RepID=UPI00382CE0F6
MDPPDGALPAPQDEGGPKLWELSPDELRTRLDAALWPEASSAHTWVPRPPMTLSDYIENGT